MRDKVLVPVELTAENGAKAALMGEFSVPFPAYCPDCHDLTDMSLEADFCETCRNTGEITHTINVPWVTIKEIWKKAIEVVAAQEPFMEALPVDSDLDDKVNRLVSETYNQHSVKRISQAEPASAEPVVKYVELTTTEAFQHLRDRGLVENPEMSGLYKIVINPDWKPSPQE